MGGLQFEFGKSSMGTSSFRTDGGARGPYFAVLQRREDVRRSILEPGGKIAEIVLDGEISDMGNYSFFRQSDEPLSAIITRIRRAAEDPSVDCLYLRVGDVATTPGLADELRRALVDFRESSGKPIVVYMEAGGDREYLIASVADSIFMEPVGELNVNGIAAYGLRARGLLDKLGIEPDFVTVGEYKSAPEIFTDSTMSATDREQMTEFWGSVFSTEVEAIARSRNMPTDSVEALINRAPFTAQDALALGLIDGIRSYEKSQESADLLVDGRPGGRRARTSMRDRRPYDESWAPRPTVAVVFATGDDRPRRRRDGLLLRRPLRRRTQDGADTQADTRGRLHRGRCPACGLARRFRACQRADTRSAGAGSRGREARGGLIRWSGGIGWLLDIV